MTAQRVTFSLDLAKVITGLAALGGFIFYAGKLDGRVENIEKDLAKVKEVIYQPVMREARREYSYTK